MGARGGCPEQSCRVFLVDATSFLQGLDGAKGEKGDSGEKGDHGDAGPAVSHFSRISFLAINRNLPYSNYSNALFLFSLRVSQVLQGLLVYPVPKERR